ncbi:DUF177 domain-containing protein [Desulfatiferula olefinivorans]
MHITVSHIPYGGLSRSFSADAREFPVLAELIDRGEYAFTAPIDVSLAAQVQTGDVIEVTGRIATSLRMDCGRCLEPFEYTFRQTFVLGFIKTDGTETVPGEEELDMEIGEEDIATEYYSGDVIELRHIIEEQVVLGLPLHPLCSDLCKGLCPSCGANLNLAPCTCNPVVGHPAFQALKKLKS